MSREVLHIVPVDDRRGHCTEGLGCTCGVSLEESGATLLVVHRAFDLRDLFEPFESQPPNPTVTN